MKKKISLFSVGVLLCSYLAGVVPAQAAGSTGSLPPYLDPTQPAAARVSDLLGRMTLDEKIGQMIQAERASVTPEEVKDNFLGSVLSGGGSFPDGKQSASTREKWSEMVDQFQDGALSTRLGIPLLYGVDALHGHNNVIDATLFPHNIGLGATRNPALVKQIGTAAAEEIKSAGTNWTFAPTIADPQNPRWGRTYEGFGDDVRLVAQMGAAYIQGLQGDTASQLKLPTKVVATAKHFFGEGYTKNGTNQGDVADFTEQQMIDKDLLAYQEAIKAGAKVVMASYSSIQGIKMHANKRLLTDVLKGQLGFDGFVVSDWNGIEQISKDWDGKAVSGLKDQLRVAIDAGVDMFMEPANWKACITDIKALVDEGSITSARIDDAASRILKVKFEAGLFEHPKTDPDLAGLFGSAAHREIARQAVRESLVLLKNDQVGGQPILSKLKSMSKIFVAGKNADDIGNQAGGWSITWQGKSGAITKGTSILKGIQDAVGTTKTVKYNLHGRGSEGYDVAIAVVGEKPYAETSGDTNNLNLDQEDLATLQNIRSTNPNIPIVVVLVSGRPLTISDQMSDWAGLIAAWLPGTEGQGVADVLFGNYDFTGKLPIRWPFYVESYPMWDRTSPNPYVLFDYGYGLTKNTVTPALPPKPAKPDDDPSIPAQAVPGKIEAESFTAQSGLQLEDSSEGTKDVGWSDPNDWLEYKINVSSPGTYAVDFRYAANLDGATGMKITSAAGNTLGTLSVGSTGGWQNWQTKTVNNVVLRQAGTQKIRLVYTGGSINLNWIEFKRVGDVPPIDEGNGNNGDNGGGGTIPQTPQTVIQPSAVESWITNERDPSNTLWYYAPRYQAGDKKLEAQPKLDIAMPDANAGTEIHIDPDKTYQSMIGMGTSMEESTVYNLWKMSPAKRTEVLKSMVSRTDGIGMSMTRVTIGTPDFTAQTFYTYDDMPAGQTDVGLDHFSIQKDRDYHIIDTLKQIKQLNPDMKFFASPWSPPGWMKTTDSMIRGQVKDEYLPVLAKYYVKYIQAYKAEGIPISAMTMQNEPLLEIDYPSTSMPWEQEARLAKLLRAELDANGLQDVKIWTFDHNPGDTMAYPAQILKDNVEGAYDAVDGTAFHDYGGDLGLMSKLHDMYPEKNVYLTERAVWGTKGADTMAKYFRNWARSYNSWVAMLDSDIHTHQWVGTPDPTPLILDSGNVDNYWAAPEFYLMGQFSKFVEPGYVRIDSNYGSADTVTNVSFKSPDGKKIVTVVINQTSKDQAVKLLVDGTQILATVPAKSVATYRWDRLQATRSVPGSLNAKDMDSSRGSFQIESGTYIGHLNQGAASATEQASFDYMVNVKESGAYDFDLSYAGNQENASVTLKQDGITLANIALPQKTYGWDNFSSIRTRVTLSAGVHKLTLTTQGKDFNLSKLSFTKAAAAIKLPGLLEAENFAAASGVLVQDTADGAAVGYADVNDWMTYNVEVPVAGTYNLTYRYAAPAGTIPHADWSENNTVIGSTYLSGSTGWIDWVTVTGALDLTAGSHTLKLNVHNAGFNLDWVAFGPTLLAKQNHSIAEGSESGAQIAVQLLNDTWSGPLHSANWKLNGLPGVKVGSMNKIDDQHALLELSGNSSVDYDTDQTAVLEAASTETVIGSVYGPTLPVSGSIRFTEINDSESLSAPQTPLPYGVNNVVIPLTLNGGQFVQDQVQNITVSGTGAVDGHISVTSVTYVSPTQVNVQLGWNNTPYYGDLKLTFNVPVTAYTDSTGGLALTADIICLGTANPVAPVNVPGTISAEKFYKMQGVSLAGGPNNSKKVTGFDAGDWIDYPIQVPEDGAYVATLRINFSSGAAKGIVLKAEDGTKLTDFNIPSVGNTNWFTIRGTVQLHAGSQKLRVFAGAGGFELNWIQLDKLTAQPTSDSGELKVEAESYVADDQGIIQDNSGTPAFQNVGYLAANKFLNYSVNIKQAGTYKITYRYATPQSGVSVEVSSGAVKLATTKMPGTGGWGSYSTVSDVVVMPQGEQTLKLLDLGDGFNLDWFALEPTDVVAVPQERTLLPRASLKAGTYSSAQVVTLTTATPGAKIYYTIDGSMPTSASTLYTDAIKVTDQAVIRAIAVGDGLKESFVAPYTYLIQESSQGGGDSGGNGGSGDSTSPVTPPVQEDSIPTIKAPQPSVDASGAAITTIEAASLTEAFSKASANSAGVKTIRIEVPKLDGQQGYGITLPSSQLMQQDGTKKMEIVTELGKILIPSNMLQGTDTTSDQVELRISSADKTGISAALQTQIGNKPVIDLQLRVNGAAVPWNHADAPVQVSIPYTPTAEELAHPERITVWYIDDQGHITPVSGSKYDAATGYVTFTTNHFSRYAVAYAGKTFKDIGSYDWAKEAIDALAAEGIIEGTGESTYTPGAPVKRADYVLLLVKALGLKAEVKSNESFADVSSTDYYYGAVGIAKKLGVTEGADGNRFEPNAPVTRQDMMTLTARAMQIAGKTLQKGSASDLDKYADRAEIAGYAVDSAATLTKNGIITGDGSQIHPLSTATRAETAVMMYRIYKK